MGLRKQYHFRNAKNGLLSWDVSKLIDKAANLPIKSVYLSIIKELDECFWHNIGGQTPTCRSVVEHSQLIQSVVMQYPIILSKDGRVMDSMHRVSKALFDGLSTINAVQFDQGIPPDYRGIYPDQLPYD
jgi:hypothetical protein